MAHYMLGNAPQQTHLYEDLADDYDYKRDPRPDHWRIVQHCDKIAPGDVFVMYHYDDRSLDAIGVFASQCVAGWIAIELRRLRNPIRRGDLARLRAWRSNGGYRKPFTVNPDGSLNPQFANAVKFTDGDGRWESIEKRMTPAELRWIEDRSRHRRRYPLKPPSF